MSTSHWVIVHGNWLQREATTWVVREQVNNETWCMGFPQITASISTRTEHLLPVPFNFLINPRQNVRQKDLNLNPGPFHLKRRAPQKAHLCSKNTNSWGLPGSPVAKTLQSQSGGQGLISHQGTRSYMPSWHSQINKYIFLKIKKNKYQLPTSPGSWVLSL